MLQADEIFLIPRHFFHGDKCFHSAFCGEFIQEAELEDVTNQRSFRKHGKSV